MSKFNENVKDLFENWNTIPNWLCFIRIALIPVFTALFVKEQYIAAFITMIVAALTDVFDGKLQENSIWCQISAKFLTLLQINCHR